MNSPLSDAIRKLLLPAPAARQAAEDPFALLPPGPAVSQVQRAIGPDTITNTLLANMAQSTIKGRAAGAGTGDPTDLTAAQVAAILQGQLGFRKPYNGSFRNTSISSGGGHVFPQGHYTAMLTASGYGALVTEAGTIKNFRIQPVTASPATVTTSVDVCINGVVQLTLSYTNADGTAVKTLGTTVAVAANDRITFRLTHNSGINQEISVDYSFDIEVSL